MNYLETVQWMFKQLPMYQNQGKSAYKKDLSNTIKLAKHLNNPENKFKSIHVAGTNGKGSTSHMLASVLHVAGYKVGLYTSPHLKDFRERIRINGKTVSKQFVIGFVRRNQEFFEKNQLSFFEMTVGMAFDYFAKENVDIAVVEVGMGGRLDSTNIITPVISVITNIGFDHMQFLGNTLKAIAGEKAGIIKRNIPVVIGETQSETKPVFIDKATINNSPIYFADQDIVEVYDSDMTGSYQKKNIKTVLQVVEILNTKKYHISPTQTKEGLLNVAKNTGLKGRWQILGTDPKIICDTAHNKEGLEYVVEQLLKEDFEKLHIVFGTVNDKDLSTIMPLLPKEAVYYLCKPNVIRGRSVNKLKDYFDRFGLDSKPFNSVSHALDGAKLNANKNDLIFVGGSTFVVAEII
ncbi:bifunctional folylpolyglutamate synthase/dihydrofolate synthase [Winogradskyella alexanderae]|uniref:Dihydrofolate synthase/folylpolyglutamate synthase n=1 Tax=Winogradskyella alexanderae TaxID=2877123 RepID=A0ABS7XVW9_9FLAO|nr:folylpolyglutamate synthase/dihydrofolate synthase family protein [Winogradskyella alexanderae]MCA0133568.1 bifunctional folylpolyglutamate synthase/dihydrofolate synthase [Winogradskyella alexanderae]